MNSQGSSFNSEVKYIFKKREQLQKYLPRVASLEKERLKKSAISVNGFSFKCLRDEWMFFLSTDIEQKAGHPGLSVCFSDGLVVGFLVVVHLGLWL